jgi:nucleoside 2-deoxyribosyltransferase
MTVYLCGGINGLDDAACRDWRQDVTAQLAGHEVLDPMRRDYRGREAGNVAAIVEGDLEDIRRADALLVNAMRASWGTAMEIVYARQMGKRIVVFTGEWPPPSPWLRYHADVVMTTPDGAVRALLSRAGQAQEPPR